MCGKKSGGYARRGCAWCGVNFAPRASREKHCSWQCRFTDIASRFFGEEGCWEWPLSTFKATGYGQFSMPSSGDVKGAHRVSFELFHGHLPSGRWVCHTCDNRRCFNPTHLFAGTPAQNVQDMWDKGRQQDYSNVVRGDNHPRRRNPRLSKWALTPSDAVLVKFWIAAGRTRRNVATHFGVKEDVVKRVRSGGYDKVITSKDLATCMMQSMPAAKGGN